MTHKPPHKHVHHHGDEENPELPKRSFSQRVLVGMGAVLLILLMTSFVFVTFPVGDILAGKSESDLIIDQVVRAGNLEIVFSDSAYRVLQEFYREDPTKEIALCLLGVKRNSTYTITKIYKPEQERSFRHVQFEPCSQETLILLHTHPRSRCIASNTDIATLRETQKANPEVLMVVMCEESRVSVYS
ncbi:hypothetical protein D6774_04970 [Candidatus Woesearchaeota archaeon]|nr:MAG: hypothetical protein D6774_04970 [Candidatus Woesearchaeota archaeon]